MQILYFAFHYCLLTVVFLIVSCVLFVDGCQLWMSQRCGSQQVNEYHLTLFSLSLVQENIFFYYYLFIFVLWGKSCGWVASQQLKLEALRDCFTFRLLCILQQSSAGIGNILNHPKWSERQWTGIRCAFEKVFLTILQYIRSVKHFPVCDQHVWHVLHIILSLYLLVALLWLVWTFVLCLIDKSILKLFLLLLFFSAWIILKYLKRINQTIDVAHN